MGLLGFFPVFVRLLAFFYFDPLLGGRRIPAQLKVGLALVMGYALALVLPAPRFSPDMEFVGLMAGILGEVMVGLAMGYMVRLVFAGIEMAGQIMGFQMGFGIINVLDPVQDVQVSLLGQFYDFLAVMILLSLNAHHVLIRAIVKSFEVVPVMGFSGFSPGFPDFLIRHSAQMLVLALTIAAPGMVALFLTNGALGIMARTFPQMNLFVVGFPITITVGIFVVMASFPLYGDVFSKAFNWGWSGVEGVLAYMG